MSYRPRRRPPPRPPIVVRQVWDFNLDFEFSLIQKSLLRYPFTCVDTEFPGTIFELDGDGGKHRREPAALYALMKRNVDASNLIQLGLTISDANGNLPNFGSEEQYLWEFNFRDFDCDRDLQNPDSISLLRRQGIDFAKNRANGVDSRDFAMYFKMSGLGLSFFGWNRVWITFHGLYDFGYFIKILTGKELPDELQDFTTLVMLYFGKQVYDLKNILELFGFHGGLERVAKSLNVDRVAGRSHQAGSDSLLTMQAFWMLLKRQQYFCMLSAMEKCNHKFYGCGIGTLSCLKRN